MFARKGRLAVIFVFVIILLLCCASAQAQSSKSKTYHSKGYTYSLNDDGSATIVKGINKKNVTIPESLKGHSVTSIGEDAFSKCTALATVTIPSSVTSIEDEAFASCSSLATITIPSSVTNIGENTFSYCSNKLTIQCSEDSIAMQFARVKGIKFSITTGNAPEEPTESIFK